MSIPEELFELYCRPKPENVLSILESLKHCINSKIIDENMCREAIELAKKVINTCNKKQSK